MAKRLEMPRGTRVCLHLNEQGCTRKTAQVACLMTERIFYIIIERGVYTRNELRGTEENFFVVYFKGYVWLEK